MIPLDIDDRLEIRAALRYQLGHEALPYLQRRLRVFGEREYQHNAASLRRADIAIFNSAVDRVQRMRRLIKAMV